VFSKKDPFPLSALSLSLDTFLRSSLAVLHVSKVWKSHNAEVISIFVYHAPFSFEEIDTEVSPSSGIGLETTILFIREGANVLMADISAPALATALEKVHKIMPPSASTHLETITCDVSSESSVTAMVAHVGSWGGVDILFNNAGIMHAADADAIDTPEKIWDLTHNINVKGVWYGCKHGVMSIRKHGKKKGSVINTASVVALVGSATPQLAYTASKGAVLALTRELAVVHAREGIRFNALCPAPLKWGFPFFARDLGFRWLTLW